MRLTPLQRDCQTIAAFGIEPMDALHVARMLAMPEVLARAFPTMPSHLRSEVMAGQFNIERDECGDWSLVSV